ncbi:MAG TPA: hypothetical protein VMX54_14920 [Vicinamibacteria bacterium]|nr:hypothetical protein [Vicinamibacteria bacterium]
MPSTPSSETPRRPPVDWARAAEGLQMAGIAVFLLLNTTGRLPWSFWLDAIALWPVLLMSAGLRIAFEKTRVPWLLLLGPALVVGSLAWLASGNAWAAPAAGPWVRQTKPLPPGTAGVLFHARLAGAQFSVTSATLDPGTLVDARSVDRGGGARLESRLDGDQAQVLLEGGARQGLALALPGRRQEWELKLPAALPLRLDLGGAGVRSELDLTRGRLADGYVKGVFLVTRLDLPATDRTVALHFGGVFDALHLTVPEGTPVHVHGAGLPFNAVDRGVSGEAGRAGYDVKVDGIFTAVAVDTRPARPPAEAEPGRPKPEAEVKTR